MGWLIALVILVLLAYLPLGVTLRYDSDGPLARVIAGPIRIQVFPGKKKNKDKGEKKEKKAKKQKAEPVETTVPSDQTASTTAAQKEKEKKGGSITDFLPLVKIVLNFVGEFRRKLRINRLDLNLVMAGGDPCDLATNYGKAWAALGNLWPKLEEWFIIKKRDVRVQCDFEGDQTLITARIELTITLGRILSLVVRHGFRAIKELFKINNKRKGGASL